LPVTRIAIREGKTPEYKQALMDEIYEAKLAMYKRIVERLGDNPGVRPEDVLISVIETAADNWSFGNGETQFYEPVDRQAAAA
jgi:phenylpyruvate tautomerase PptA (4-oxalocrotonate tautomerase family)